ncbi:BRD4-interacting chromatin-remodeling complex-associated protein-like isoform X2 [Hyperolius riggenbachi]|uniref:BRD4-interacting chromatin-remodeling complex-associated protein-like isoform X2 n=1 Tax=Hyperolius riggenbachi TaxID=752182 RepID=UPI0035A2FB61
MDDDDDAGLLDFIGSTSWCDWDPQALNYYLHGSGDKSTDNELTDTEFSASNSNSIFANANLGDPKSSTKTCPSSEEEESKDGMELSTSIQYYEDELEPSPMADLTEDILQKSLQEANITEQILAEEAYLDASIGSGQQFSNVPFHSHSSASFTSTDPSYSGHTIHPIGVTHVPVVPQQFASNTVGVQHGFMQHVGIIPSQQMQNSSHGSSGQIHVIGSINNQSPVMTINNLDGSQIILKSGQQVPTSSSGGLLVQRQTPNGSAMFGSPNTSPAGQPVAVPFNSGNFQTSLPVHNIIIHRGPVPNCSKAPINIQPKPMQIGQQASYSVSHVGMHHHGHQGIPFVTTTQCSPMSQQVPANHQRSRKASSQQSGGGGGIVLHSPGGQQQHGHQNQFIIPAGLSLSTNSMQQIQCINSQLVQAQSSHLGHQQVPAEHLFMSRNSSTVGRSTHQYPGQMLHSPGSALQIVPGQTFTSSGGQVILNHGPSQGVGGQVSQLSPPLLHLSPGQSTTNQEMRSGISSSQSSCPNMPPGNRFTVVSTGAGLQRTGTPFSRGGDSYLDEHEQNRAQHAMHEINLQSSNAKNNRSLSPKINSQQTFSHMQTQKKLCGPLSPVSSLKNPERQSFPQSSSLTEHSSGITHLQHQLSQLQNVKVEGHHRGLKRFSTRQLTKETLFLQKVHADQEIAVLPDKSPFQSLGDAVRRLLPFHVFQGSMPAEEEIQKVDNEFEAMATHLLKKTQAMLNKYRLLLLEDAKRITPSAEMVMLDRIFNQEERSSLTRDKRTAVIDPDGYLTEFCCFHKFDEDPADEKQLSDPDMYADQTSDCSSPMDLYIDDQADFGSPKTPDTPCLVPTDSSPIQKCDASPVEKEEKEGLKNDTALKNATLPPTKQLFVNICKLKGKYTSCASDAYTSCKASKESGAYASPPKSIPVSGSPTDSVYGEHPQAKVPGEILETSGEQSHSTVPSKSLMSSEAVKATVRNVLELKLSAKHLKSQVSGSDFPETDSVRCPEENCLERPASHSRGGAAETDSVLEAAVNSILDC